jgi:carbamoyltransferase
MSERVMENILGLAGLLIDGASCLIKDNKIAAAIEEERYSRIKHTSIIQSGGLPYASIDTCLKMGGLYWKEIDHVGYAFEPWREFCSLSKFRFRRSCLSPSTLGYYQIYYLDTLRKHLLVPRLVKSKCKRDVKFHWFGHHLCHAASSYYVSPYENSAVLIMDALGEIECTSFYHAKGPGIKKLLSYNFPHSLGFLYATLTDYLGFRSNNDEYKVMGLASFGKPGFYEKLKDVVHVKPNGEIRLNYTYFNRFFRGREYVNEKFYSVFGPKRMPGEELTERHRDVAASLQLFLEESVMRMAKHLYDITGSQNLCLGGGVALNCTMNGRLLREGPFKNIFIQPACHDAGGALGAALLVKHEILKLSEREELKNPYFGEEFSNEQIKKQLEESKVAYQYCDDIVSKGAELIAGGNIVGWFQGRGEWGPRALGNRSILADPTRPDMQDLINKHVKHRDEFRPFAPSVTAEDVDKFFEGIKASPFMLFVVKAKDTAREKIPAVIHINGTSRVQTVSREVNPRYYSLLRAFEKLKGVPVLLNTSFNVNKEPIVNSPADAIKCFYSTGIDYLVMGNYLVSKNR